MFRIRRSQIATTIIAISMGLIVSSQQYAPQQPPQSRRLDIEVLNSDSYAQSILSVQTPKSSPLVGIGEQEHARITSILERTKELTNRSRELVKNQSTLKQGQDMLAQANTLFSQVKDIIKQQQGSISNGVEEDGGGGHGRDLLRKKYQDHDLTKVQEDSLRSLYTARNIYAAVSCL